MPDLLQEVGSGEATVGCDRVADGAGTPPWDTEVFLVHGADRDEVLARARTLQRFVEANRTVDLKDLAHTLNTGTEGSDGRCLALVAGAAEHLLSRLGTAIARLEDPGRTQIKDTAGIYYADRPLHPEGSLALLFPGEGGEYLNMMADLCPHFPEVRAAFEVAEQLAWEASPATGRRFARLFRLSETASAEERDEAETALVELDAIASGVLLADRAMFALVSAIGLRPAAMAGHSLGELAAIQACGAIEGGREQLARVGALLNELVSRKAAGTIAPAISLAVGAGRPAVEEVVRETALAGVFLAMDNCPHQTIAVGPSEVMEALEAALKARHFITERLPFDIPYHTPLFEPHLGPIRALIAAMPFRTPRGAVLYSCATGAPLDPDPATIREHAISSFVRPVEFTSLVRAMHRDGVRLFVECGPRGNLTSFVEDILRKERFAAIASNLPTRSGVTQLNHLAGQLAAHRVPMSLAHLYRRRTPRRLDWERAGSRSAAATPISAAPAGPRLLPGPETIAGATLEARGLPRSGRPSRGDVLVRHLDLMEQFLDDQADVMAAFRGRRRWGTSPPIMLRPAEGTETPALAAFPLLTTATVLAFEAGREIVVRRPLDLGEDLFVSHHTLGGHTVSRVDPDQRGLPVMPMTGTLEIMAELGAALVPGRKAIAIEDVRLFRWLAFEGERPAIEASARLLPGSPEDAFASDRVALEIHILGEGGSRSAAGQGTVLLAEDYPEAPHADDLRLGNLHPCTISVEVLHRNLFHGPLFRGTRSCGRSGDEGLEAEIEILARDGLLRSEAAPRFAMDPVTLDVGMHAITAWHLEFEDQSGRLLLPVELKRIELFGAQLPPGTRLANRCLTHGSGYRHFHHSVELVRPDGRLWSRMQGLTLWRFYLPFRDTNFFGPRDEFVTSRPWELGLGDSASCVRLDPPPDQRQATIRSVTATSVLSSTELAAYGSLDGEAEEVPWLFTRLAAKDAVRTLWHGRHGERLFPADIVIDTDEDGALRARPRGEAAEPFPAIAVAHRDDTYVAVASFEHRVGVGLDRIGAGDPDDWPTRTACATAAAAQALGCGADGLATASADPPTGQVELVPDRAGGPRDRITARTAREGDMVVAICLCERTAE